MPYTLQNTFGNVLKSSKILSLLNDKLDGLNFIQKIVVISYTLFAVTSLLTLIHFIITTGTRI